MSTMTTGSTVAAPVPTAARPQASPVPIARPGVVERRNFAHAACTACGWRGPGRRARSVAAEDGDLHALAGCGI